MHSFRFWLLNPADVTLKRIVVILTISSTAILSALCVLAGLDPWGFVEEYFGPQGVMAFVMIAITISVFPGLVCLDFSYGARQRLLQKMIDDFRCPWCNSQVGPSEVPRECRRTARCAKCQKLWREVYEIENR